MKGRLPKEGSDLYLPEHTYRMVQHFCMAYREMVKERNDISVLRSPVIDDMPHGSGTSDPTAREAVRLTELTRRIDIIETAIRETSSGNRWLFLSVTEGKSYRELVTDYGCPYDRNAFTRMRRSVYWKVAQEI